MSDGSEQAAPVSTRRLWAGAGGLVVVVGTAYFLLPLEGLGADRPWLGWPLFALCLGLLAALLLRQVRDVVLEKPHTRPGVMIPLLMCLAVLVFSSGYYALAQRPGQFTGLNTRVDALYFTVVTLATVGYGDITPSGQEARLVAVAQILYAFVFLTAAATALSRRLHAVVAARDRRPPPS
ncbi:potassium channel family protein [Streptomyces coeruleorubidus]|uniref:Two pore domain potassium channel family protein n=1 Tax=Streptomyces coeruleorubidus TaxID=116188 RepID=A0A5J6I7V9_STRC4|nr:potassium channel family protein [Streptomyces coeruleorubidus]QEV28526.1 two pore domain potassium channel family protein [Streptomyces coeruleorubidus]